MLLLFTIFFFNDTATTEIYTLSLHDASSDLALTVKLSKYNVDDVALGVCKTGAEEAGVTEVRTSLSERSEERFSRNAETDVVCRLLLEKKKIVDVRYVNKQNNYALSIYIFYI